VGRRRSLGASHAHSAVGSGALNECDWGEEPSLTRVNGAIESRPVISWVNLVEVYHRLERDHGRDAADETLGLLRANLAAELPGSARMIEVAA